MTAVQVLEPMVTVINGFCRYKITCKFSPTLISFFKTIDGRYYDFCVKLWSFPNDSWRQMEAFLEDKEYSYKMVKAEDFVTVTKTPYNLQLKFGGFQEDFKVFEKISGSKYDRALSKYVIPLEKESELLQLLEERKFTHNILHNNELKIKPDSTSEKGSNEENVEEETVQPIKNSKFKRILSSSEEEDEEIVEIMEKTPLLENPSNVKPKKRQQRKKRTENKENFLA